MESHQNKIINYINRLNSPLSRTYGGGGGNPLNCDLDKSPAYKTLLYFYESLSQILYYAVIARFCIAKSWQSILVILESKANRLPFANLTAIPPIRYWFIYFAHCFKLRDLDCFVALATLRASRNDWANARFFKSHNNEICAILRIAFAITNLFHFPTPLKGVKMLI